MTLENSMPQRRPMKVLLDADTGVDDALGMIYLGYAQHLGLVDIVGIGTVGGNTHVDKTTRNTLRLCELLALEVPVAKGANKPLLSPLKEATHVHGDDGLANTNLAPPRRRETGEHAVDQILRLSHDHAGELVLLAFGPLTNLGIAFVRDPGLARRVRRVVLMGGSTHAGNVTATAEANIANDPEAARMVFCSEAPITMIGLNVTHQTCLTVAHLKGVQARANDRSRFLSQLIRFMMDAYVQFGYEPPICVLHDPLSAGVCVHPDLVETERLFVDVETDGRFTRGMTVVDYRPKPAHEPTVDVAVEVDCARFVDEFMQALHWWVAQDDGKL